MHYCQFSEIFVQCNQNAAFIVCASQYFLIAGVFIPIARTDDIMSGGFKFLSDTAPNTGI